MFKSRSARLSTRPRRLRVIKRGQINLEVGSGSIVLAGPIVSDMLISVN